MIRQHTNLQVLITLLFLCLGSTAQAESLTEEEARQAAAAFFSSSSSSTRLRAKGRQLMLRSRGHEAGYYVFDRPEGGCVFVADDDAVGRTVLGYTDRGSYDAENLPTGFRDWLDQIAVVMRGVHEGKIQRQLVEETRGRQAVVEPLIKTAWDQRYPYNSYCPVVGGTTCLTGCVATAMAQVMNYWRWPVHGFGTASYKDDGCGQRLTQNLSDDTYDWDHMLNSYSGDDYSIAQIRAIATLMRDCGYAVQMHYGTRESSASVSAQAMRTYFHYSATAKDRGSNYYPEDLWHEYIRQDLNARRPVLYSGQKSESGHEFIIDGYDQIGYYHVNWGWGGYQDGWFTLTNLNGYNDDQWMINRLQPDYIVDDNFSYTLADSVLTINGTGMMPTDYMMQNAPWRDECEAIRKVVIGQGITGVIDRFSGYYDERNQKWWELVNLEEVVLPEGLEYLGENCFSSTKLSSVQIPSTVVRMDYALSSCYNLKSLHLPAGVEEYIDNLPAVQELTVDPENPWLCTLDNVLYSKNRHRLILAPSGLSRIVIAETTEAILDESILYWGIPIYSKCTTAPTLSKWVMESQYSVGESGYLFIPVGATGYDRWKKILKPGWTVLNYSDFDYLPDMRITWTLDDAGTLTLSGWGEQKYEEYGYRNAPYFQYRDSVKRLVVNEGVKTLCWSAYSTYESMTTVELPSTLSRIEGYCFDWVPSLSSITCRAQTAPELGGSSLYGLSPTGTLHIPLGADYSSWVQALPEGWTIERFTPEPMATCRLYNGEERRVADMKEWDALLEEYPNTIGIVNPMWEEWAYLTRNLLVADTLSGTYRCPYLLLTDLIAGFSTTKRAPQTGFAPPQSFTAMKGAYNRQVTSGYNTVCLPFIVYEDSLPEVCRMYVYSHYDRDKGDVVFTPQAQTEAGHPCIIVSETDADWCADLKGLTIAAQPSSAADGKMRGTFLSTDDHQGRGYSPRSRDNVFAPLAQYLHPFRACLFVNDANAPAEVRVRLADADDDVTGIVEVTTASPCAIYSLDGRRLTAPVKGQPYIKNGKIMIR